MPPITAALITAGASVANAVLANRARKQEAELQYQRQVRAIREQNEYNTPASQVMRLKAAGLNPAIAYGGQGAVVGNQDQVPEYQQPNYESSAFSEGASLIQSAVDVRQQQNLNALTEADMALKTAQSFLAYTSGNLNNKQADAVTRTLLPTINEINARIQHLWSQTDLNTSNIEINDERKNEIIAHRRLFESQVAVTDFELYKMASLLPKELLNMDMQNRLLWIQGEQGQQWMAESLNRMACDSAMVGVACGRLRLDTAGLFIQSDQFNRSLDLSERQFGETVKMNKFARRKGWVDTFIGGYGTIKGVQNNQQKLIQDWTIDLSRIALLYGSKIPMVAVP